MLINDAAHPGQFLTPQIYSQSSANPLTIVTADFDGDGILDLGTGGYDDINRGLLSIYRGDPAHPGQFLAPQNSLTGGAPVASLKVGDFNGDGLPDLAVADNTEINNIEPYGGPINNVFIFLGDAAHPGSFHTPDGYSQSPLGTPSNLSIGDFDGDGILDLAIGGASSQEFDGPPVASFAGVTIYPGDAANPGHFMTPVLYVYPAEAPLLSKSLVDLNGDGLTDISGTALQYASTGSRPFTTGAGYTIQLARRTETAVASGVNTGSTSYAFANYAGDSTYGSVVSCEIPLDMTSATPAIYSAKVSSITATSAVVSWTSNVATYGSVEYQPLANQTSNYAPLETPWDPSETTTHSFTLSGLTPGTGYYYKIQAQAYFSGCNHYTASTYNSFITANQ